MGLINALVDYAFDVPDDCDRGHLNNIPSPSPTKSVLRELIRREEWHEIMSVIHDLAGMKDGFVLQWTAEIVRSVDGIKDEVVHSLVKDAIKDHDAIIPQTKAFLDSFFGRWSR